MHGNARGRKDDGTDYNQLYAWSNAIERKNTRGIPKFVESSVNKVALHAGYYGVSDERILSQQVMEYIFIQSR